MATYTPEPLSGATNGRNIKVEETATPGTLIHTAHLTSKDEIFLWATNTDSVARLLTIEFGGTTSPDDLIQMSVPAQAGARLVIPGLRLTGGVEVRAFAAAADVINVNGYVNRIS